MAGVESLFEHRRHLTILGHLLLKCISTPCFHLGVTDARLDNGCIVAAWCADTSLSAQPHAKKLLAWWKCLPVSAFHQYIVVCNLQLDYPQHCHCVHIMVSISLRV